MSDRIIARGAVGLLVDGPIREGAFRVISRRFGKRAKSAEMPIIAGL